MRTSKIVNTKDSITKFCTDCEIDLTPGTNCYASQYKRKIYTIVSIFHCRMRHLGK